jgi:serine/threonine-protein kinase
MQPPTRIDYYEQQRTQQMGQQTMMGVAPTTVSPYQQTGYQTGYQQPYGYGNGGQDGGGQDQRRGNRRWIPWVISGLVVLAAIIVAVIMLNNGGSGGTANVPLVNGESYAQAATQIKAAGLNPVRNNESSSVKAGMVISTNPDNGNSVAKNSNVTVNVSTGPANIALPNLQGQQSSAAQQQLKNAGFSNVSVVSDSQSTLPNNEVDHQSPAPGSYPPNQAITLYVSGGGIKVPSVTNDTAAEAMATLTGLGFTNVHTVSTAAPASQMVEPGTVYNQTPASGQVVPSSALIQIFVQPQNSSTPTPSNSGSPTDTSTPTGGGTPTDGGTPTTTPSPGSGLGGL